LLTVDPLLRVGPHQEGGEVSDALRCLALLVRAHGTPLALFALTSAGLCGGTERGLFG
jgi:hypothetical protein